MAGEPFRALLSVIVGRGAFAARSRAGAASLVLWLSALNGMTACAGSDPSPPAGEAILGPACVDADGDGFGTSCPAGRDCDDADPTVTNECYRCNQPGGVKCGCQVEGEQVACGHVVETYASFTLCGVGVTTCIGGVWSACRVDRSVKVPTSPSRAAQGLGGQTSCPGSGVCDPYCMIFGGDTTEGLATAGLAYSNGQDGGLTLPVSASGSWDAGSWEAGVVTVEAGAVVSCTGGGQGSCTHNMCYPGVAMLPGCDDNGCAAPSWPSVPVPQNAIAALQPACGTAGNFVSGCAILPPPDCQTAVLNPNDCASPPATCAAAPPGASCTSPGVDTSSCAGAVADSNACVGATVGTTCSAAATSTGAARATDTGKCVADVVNTGDCAPRSVDNLSCATRTVDTAVCAAAATSACSTKTSCVSRVTTTCSRDSSRANASCSSVAASSDIVSNPGGNDSGTPGFFVRTMAIPSITQTGTLAIVQLTIPAASSVDRDLYVQRNATVGQNAQGTGNGNYICKPSASGFDATSGTGSGNHTETCLVMLNSGDTLSIGYYAAGTNKPAIEVKLYPPCAIAGTLVQLASFNATYDYAAAWAFPAQVQCCGCSASTAYSSSEFGQCCDLSACSAPNVIRPGSANLECCSPAGTGDTCAAGTTATNPSNVAQCCNFACSDAAKPATKPGDITKCCAYKTDCTDQPANPNAVVGSPPQCCAYKADCSDQPARPDAVAGSPPQCCAGSCSTLGNAANGAGYPLHVGNQCCAYASCSSGGVDPSNGARCATWSACAQASVPTTGRSGSTFVSASCGAPPGLSSSALPIAIAANSFTPDHVVASPGPGSIVTIAMTGIDKNSDLYVYRGAASTGNTSSGWDCRPHQSGTTNETCVFYLNNDDSLTWRVYRASSAANATVTVTIANCGNRAFTTAGPAGDSDCVSADGCIYKGVAAPSMANACCDCAAGGLPNGDGTCTVKSCCGWACADAAHPNQKPGDASQCCAYTCTGATKPLAKPGDASSCCDYKTDCTAAPSYPIYASGNPPASRCCAPAACPAGQSNPTTATCGQAQLGTSCSAATAGTANSWTYTSLSGCTTIGGSGYCTAVGANLVSASFPVGTILTYKLVRNSGSGINNDLYVFDNNGAVVCSSVNGSPTSATDICVIVVASASTRYTAKVQSNSSSTQNTTLTLTQYACASATALNLAAPWSGSDHNATTVPALSCCACAAGSAYSDGQCCATDATQCCGHGACQAPRVDDGGGKCCNYMTDCSLNAGHPVANGGAPLQCCTAATTCGAGKLTVPGSPALCCDCAAGYPNQVNGTCCDRTGPYCTTGTLCNADTQCCDPRCPPTSGPPSNYGDFTVKNGANCENHTCSACAEGSICHPGSATTCCTGGGCVSHVCATTNGPRSPNGATSYAKCCSTGWDADCIWLASQPSPVGCALTCALTDQDHDGFADIDDCAPCDPMVNPGAYDWPGNGVDDDCSGGDAPRSAATCDTALAIDSSSPLDYAKALELCQTTTIAGKAPGVITDGPGAPGLVHADGKGTPAAVSHAIESQFGTDSYNAARAGSKFAVLSTGAARYVGQTGYVRPQTGFDRGENVTVAAMQTELGPHYPAVATKAGCPQGTSQNDSIMLKFQVRVPTNVKGYSYSSQFFTAEYPEWTCSQYNDVFLNVVDGALVPDAAPNWRNVLFDTKGNPVTVNLAGVFFPIPGSPTFDSPALAGTGFGGLIANSQGGSNSYARKTTVLGGSTGWLTTTVPVQPGEIMTIRYVLWDSSDHLFDSTAIIDNWQWLQAEPPIQTNPGGGASAPLPPSPPAYVMQGHFDRDYNAACPPGSPPVWGLWSWDSFAPSDSYLAFEVAVADTQAGLDSATYGALLFSGKGGGTLFSYPVDDGGVGYSGADDQVAQSRMSYPYGAVSLDTEVGSLPVDYALQKLRFDTISPWVRIRSNLHASTDRLSAPVLNSWSLTYDCPPSQ